MTPSIRAARNLIGNPEIYAGWPTYQALVREAWIILSSDRDHRAMETLARGETP